MNAGDNLKAKYESWKSERAVKKEKNRQDSDDDLQDTHAKDEIQRRKNKPSTIKSALKGAAIGAGVGGGLGIGALSSQDKDVIDQNVSMIPQSSVFGAGAGAGLGALHSIYKKRKNKRLSENSGMAHKTNQDLLDIRANALKKMQQRGA